MVTRPSTAVYSYTQNYRYSVTIEYSDNSNPTLTLSSLIDNPILTENTTFSIQGNASDVDKDNVVIIKYHINNSTTRVLQSGVSNDSTSHKEAPPSNHIGNTIQEVLFPRLNLLGHFIINRWRAIFDVKGSFFIFRDEAQNTDKYG